MTLTEALRALHGSGRIAREWLPGMRTDRPHWRAYAHADGLSAAGEPAGYCADWEALFGGIYPTQRQPDLTDPATVGCLVALAREVLDEEGDDPPLWTGPSHPVRYAVFRRVDGMWEEWVFGETEGEAWAAALISLAGAL